MEVGDTITFPFGKGEKEGTIYKIFPTTVYIKADFPKHKGKIIKRSIMDVQPMKEGKKTKEEGKKEAQKAKKKEAKTKQRAKAPQEGRKKEKVVKKSTK
jgi:hypothetical protein